MYGIPQLFVFISRKDTAPSLLELIDYPTVTALTFESVSNIKSLPSLFTKAVSSLPLLLTLGQKVMFTLHCDDEIRSLDRESSQNSHFAKIMTSDDVNTSFNALTLLLDQPILQNKKEHAFRTFVWKHYQSEVLLESLQSFDTPKLFREYCLQFITLLNEKSNRLLEEQF